MAEQLTHSPTLVPLCEYRLEFQWTTPEVLALEAKVLQTAKAMASQAGPTGLDASDQSLSDEQNAALVKVGSEIGGIAIVQGAAGTGKSTLFRVAAENWRSRGAEVFGAALTGKAARGLGEAAEIPTDTLHSAPDRIKAGHLRLHRDAVLIVDACGKPVSTRGAAAIGGAKVRSPAALRTSGPQVSRQGLSHLLIDGMSSGKRAKNLLCPKRNEKAIEEIYRSSLQIQSRELV